MNSPTPPSLNPLRFTIPGDAVPQGRARMTRDGHVYTPTKTRNFHAVVRMAAATAMATRMPLEGPLKAVVAILIPVPASWSTRKREMALNGSIRPASKPDLDNRVKAIFDGMGEVVFAKSDAQIAELIAWKAYSEKPRTEVQISPIAMWQERERPSKGARDPERSAEEVEEHVDRRINRHGAAGARHSDPGPVEGHVERRARR